MGLGCIAIPNVYYAKSSCADKGLNYLPGPFLTMLMQVIGHWKFHLDGAALTLCATIATAFASQYWYVIVQGYPTYKTVKLSRCSHVSLGLKNGHHQ